MPLARRPVILFSLILILLIGGGALGFHLHLRKQAAPEFGEIDAFMRRIPISTEWKMTYSDTRQEIIPNVRPAWFGYLGLSRNKTLTEHTYWFKRKRPRLEEGGLFVVKHEGGRIQMVQVAFPSASKMEMSKRLLDAYPNLEPKLKRP